MQSDRAQLFDDKHDGSCRLTKTYRGSCHCGAIVFEIDTVLAEFTKCNCSLCTKKNAIMTKVHESEFRLLAGETDLGTYRWNTMAAKHHFCTKCGIYTFHHKRSAPGYMGVNVFCLDDADIEGVKIVQTNGRSMTLVDEA